MLPWVICLGSRVAHRVRAGKNAGGVNGYGAPDIVLERVMRRPCPDIWIEQSRVPFLST